MRLDIYLTDKGMFESRSKSKTAIEEGLVTVNGESVTKPAYEVEDGDEVTVTKGAASFVSRGGLKLSAALCSFGIDPAGKNCLDIGASAGGFTDCLLQNGAAGVTAVDSGKNQLHPSLKKDRRVVPLEGYNARHMTSDLGSFEIAVMDVSFISQTLILPVIPNVLSKSGVLISLIKPQFELDRKSLNKRGVVKTEKDRKKAIKRVLEQAAACGFKNTGIIQSPVPGGDGNIEYLACFTLEKKGGRQHK